MNGTEAKKKKHLFLMLVAYHNSNDVNYVSNSPKKCHLGPSKYACKRFSNYAYIKDYFYLSILHWKPHPVNYVLH